MGGFQENEGTMELPDEKPAIFNMFVDWLYRSDSQVGRCKSAEGYLGLFKLYFFAERLCINDLQNRVIDCIRMTAAGVMNRETKGPWITIPLAAFIFGNTSKGSPIRQYCIQELAYRLWDEHRYTSATLPGWEDMSAIFSHWSHEEDLIKGYFDFLHSAPTEIDSPWTDD